MITTIEIMASTVRLLTLNEPFASLMLCGKGETRKNPTNVRGLVCIHSAQKRYPSHKVWEISGINQVKRIVGMAVPRGTMEHIIAIGRLVNCRPMTKDDEDLCFIQYREPWQEWSEKQQRWVDKRLYVYEFEDMTAIEPVKYKGSQGWSLLTEDVKRLIIPNLTPNLRIAVDEIYIRFSGMESYFEKTEDFFAAFCQSQMSGGIGMKIRNHFNFWTDLKSDLFIELSTVLNCEDPDAMSDLIIRSVYRLNKINENNLK